MYHEQYTDNIYKGNHEDGIPMYKIKASPSIPHTNPCNGKRCGIKNVIHEKQYELFNGLVEPRKPLARPKHQVTISLPDYRSK
jgi:hypothetical protein